MLALGSVKGPKSILAWFAESPEGTGLGYRNLPIKSYDAGWSVEAQPKAYLLAGGIRVMCTYQSGGI
jgi:hypothetical protein